MFFLKILWNEIKKEVLTAWSYKLQWLGEFLSLIIFFLFLISMTKERQIAGVSYCLWFYSILIIGDISGKISSEMRSGTFEQVYLAVIPIPFLLLAKVISAIVRSFIIMGGLFVLLWSLGYINLSILEVTRIIYIMIIVSPGLLGLSLLLGGLTILLKEIGWLINIINNSLLFLSGIFIPIENLPNWFQYISCMSIISSAVDCVKTNHNENEFFLYIVSVIYFLIGSMVFLYCEKKAKLRGCLGHF